MSNYKNFQGKTLDDAIREACDYYGVEREKLEIEILSDAKTGIFGLVGAKKASIRAARAQLSVVSLMAEPDAAEASPAGQSAAQAEPVAEKPGKASREPAAEKGGKTRPKTPEGGKPARGGEPAEKDARSAGREDRSKGSGRRPSPRSGTLPESTVRSAETSDGEAPVADEKRRSSSGRERSRDSRGRRDTPQSGKPRPGARQNAPAGGAAFPAEALGDTLGTHGFDEHGPDGAREDMPEFTLEGCDEERLFSTVGKVVRRLIMPIVGDVPCTVAITGNRVRAVVDCGDASGLLVGREGQTLASVQYLASRIIAREIGGSLRLQIDAGNYRERQDDRLKELALALAEKVKQTRRSQSTRPLTAYQRRIVHLALEGDDAVQTHSKGEGAQRRVIIQLRRAERPLAGADTVPAEDTAPPARQAAGDLASIDPERGAVPHDASPDIAGQRSGDALNSGPPEASG